MGPQVLRPIPEDDATGPVFDSRWVDVPWRDVETKGFVVIPSLLSLDECSELVAQYRLVAGDDRARVNQNYASPTLPRERAERFFPRLGAIAARMAKETRSNVDTVRPTQFYSTDHGTQYGWHNDHDPHFFHQDAIRYLNFWVPILKEDPKRTGLTVAPLDTMLEKFPELGAWLVGHGAIMVTPARRGTLFTDADRLQTRLVAGPHPLEQIAVTPGVRPGDAIVMRGDLLHKTQDAQTARIAVSFRMSSSQSIISRAELTHMGSHKFNLLATNRARYAARFAAFEVTGKDEMTAGEIDAVAAALFERLAAVKDSHQGERITHDQFRDVVIEYAAELAERLQTGGTGDEARDMDEDHLDHDKR